jgi:hypothetical protein
MDAADERDPVGKAQEWNAAAADEILYFTATFMWPNSGAWLGKRL